MVLFLKDFCYSQFDPGLGDSGEANGVIVEEKKEGRASHRN